MESSHVHVLSAWLQYFENFNDILKLYEDRELDEVCKKENSKFFGFGNLLRNIDDQTRKKARVFAHFLDCT